MDQNNIVYTLTTVIKGINDVESFIRETHFLTKLKDSPYVIDLLESNMNIYSITISRADCDLDTYIGNNIMSLDQKKTICHQIACGVAHIQSAGIYHSDYKLENILVFGSSVKICDFGISHYHNKQSREDFTISYRAPELLLRHSYKGISNEYTFASDIWALGVIFYSVMQNVNLPLFGKKFRLSYLYNILKFTSPTEPLMETYSEYCQEIFGTKPDHVESILERLDNELVDNMLRLDSNTRFTIDQVLCHQWFDGKQYTPLEFPKDEVVQDNEVVNDMCEIFIPNNTEVSLAAVKYNTQQVNEDDLMNALTAVNLAIVLYCCDDLFEWNLNIEQNELPNVENEELIQMSTLV